MRFVPRLRIGASRWTLIAAGLVSAAPAAWAWGDKGHRVVALVAWDHMSPAAKQGVTALFATDPNPFPMRDHHATNESFDRQATWADYYRDSQRGPGVTADEIHSYHWHFADIEIHGGSLEQACYGFQTLPEGEDASDGPDPDCAVVKIEQFATELASSTVSTDEKRLALKYLMHFVGDIHQPLHASDDADRGGNSKSAVLKGGQPEALHHHWDVSFVDLIASTAQNRDPSPQQVHDALKAPTSRQVGQWQRDPNPRRWALESYAISRRDAYGDLPAPSKPAGGTGVVYKLDQAYASQATKDVASQLSKAGVRLAALLNNAFK